MAAEEAELAEAADLWTQALRTSRSRVGHQGPPIPPQNLPTGEDALWRWGPAFRAQTVLAQMLPRAWVDGSTLWRTDAGEPVKVIELKDFASPAKSYAAQIDKVLRGAVERDQRYAEILTQADDIWPFFSSLIGLPPGMTPHTELLLQVAWQWAGFQVMALKHGLAALRPFQRNAMVEPLIPTPPHGSLPSGHATVATLTSEICIALLYANRTKHPRVQQLDRLARRIAFNRLVAGVHFPVDSAAGYALGQQLAALFLAWAGHRKVYAASWDYQPVPNGKTVVDQEELRETDARAIPDKSTAKAAALPLLGWLWDKASKELAAFRY